MAETDYGIDLPGLPGGPPDELFGVISGRRVLAESLARRITCPPGGLFWAPTKGIDLRAEVRARLDSTRLTRIQARTQAQVLDDERVIDARVSVAWLASTRTLRVAVSAESADGPFSFVLSVGEARTELFGFTED
jgi:hypothetical protein